MGDRRVTFCRWVDPLWAISGHARDVDDPDEDDGYPWGNERPGVGPALISSQGVIPVHESMLPSRLFNLWMAHTNFSISESVVNRIKRVPGVETLDVFTRYRFRLGIGRLFNEDAVKKAIVEVCQPPSPYAGTIARLRLMGPSWAIFRGPSGKVDVAAGGSPDEVQAVVSHRTGGEGVYLEKSW